jgi:hypothetical protein
MGWVVSVTPRPRFPPGKRTPVPIGQEAGWAPEPVWTQKLEEKSSAPPRIEPRSPGRPMFLQLWWCFMSTAFRKLVLFPSSCKSIDYNETLLTVTEDSPTGLFKVTINFPKFISVVFTKSSIPGIGKLFFPLASVSRPALGPTQPPVQWVAGVLSPGLKRGRGVTLTTHPHLVPRSRMSRSYTSSPPKRLRGV